MTQYNPFPYYEPDDESRMVNDGYAPPHYEMEDESAPSELVCHCPSCSSSLSIDASTAATANLQCMVCGTVFSPLGNAATPPAYYETPAPSYPASPPPSHAEPPYNAPSPYSQPAPPIIHQNGTVAAPYYSPAPPVYPPPVNPVYRHQSAYFRTPSSGYQSAFQEPEYRPPVSSAPAYTVQNYDSGYNPSQPPAYGYDVYERQPAQGFERHNPLTAPPAPSMQPPMPHQAQSAPMAVSPPPYASVQPSAPLQTSPPAPPLPSPPHMPPVIQQLPVRPPRSSPTPAPTLHPESESPVEPTPVTKAKVEETAQSPEQKPSSPPLSPEEQAKQAEKEALTGTDAPLSALNGEVENGNATQPFKLVKSEFDYYMREEDPPIRKKGSFFKIIFFMFLPLVGIGWSLWRLLGEGHTDYYLYGGLSLFCFIVFWIALSACNRSCPQCGRWSALSKENKSDQYGSFIIRHCRHCDYMLESER